MEVFPSLKEGWPQAGVVMFKAHRTLNQSNIIQNKIGEYLPCWNYKKCLNDSIRHMMILRNNQGDCLRVGLSKQSRSAAARIAWQKQAL
jgi:hypothetical protein